MQVTYTRWLSVGKLLAGIFVVLFIISVVSCSGVADVKSDGMRVVHHKTLPPITTTPDFNPHPEDTPCEPVDE